MTLSSLFVGGIMAIASFFSPQHLFGTTVCITAQGCTGTSTPSGILYGDNGSTTHLNTVTIGSNLTYSGGTLSANTQTTAPAGSAGQVQYNATGAFGAVATNTVTCSGLASCTGFTVIGAADTITVSAGASPIATSSAETAGQLSYWTTTAGYPATLGSVATGTLSGSGGITVTGGGVIVGANTTVACATCALFGYPFTPITNFGQTFPMGTTSTAYINSALYPSLFSVNASSTALSSTIASFGGTATSSFSAAGALTLSTALTVSNGGTGASTLTGCLTGNGTGAITGSGTCATFAWPWTTTTVFGTTTRATTTPEWFQTGLYASSTSQFGSATTTTLGITNELVIPQVTSLSVTNAGEMAINTKSASSSLQFATSSASTVQLFDVTPSSFTYATATPAGTTTIMVAGSLRAMSYVDGGCQSIGGTVNVQLGNGSASTTLIVSGTSPTATTLTNFTSNNNFSEGVVRYIALGGWSSTAITNVSCTYDKRFTN